MFCDVCNQFTRRLLVRDPGLCFDIYPHRTLRCRKSHVAPIGCCIASSLEPDTRAIANSHFNKLRIFRVSGHFNLGVSVGEN